MRHILILVLAISLLFGCAGSSTQTGANGTAKVPAGSANATVPASPSATGNGTATQVPEDKPAEPQNPPAKTYSASFSALAVMGIPLECGVNYTYSGKPATARLLIGTDSDIRVESSVGMVQCRKTITVIHDNRQYVGCSDKQVMPSCDWFKSGYDPANPGVASNFDFSGVPASSISCRDWEYDPSLFKTNGTVCELG
jgi:hypothetical protein